MTAGLGHSSLIAAFVGARPERKDPKNPFAVVAKLEGRQAKMHDFDLTKPSSTTWMEGFTSRIHVNENIEKI